MKCSLSILALSISLGIPSVIAISETCHVDFKQVWADKVRKIQEWNRKHPKYVQRHHLDRDMSAEARRLKEQARKSLGVACEIGSIPVDTGSSVRMVGGRDFAAHSEYIPESGASYLDMAQEEIQGLIPPVDYPVYNISSMVYTSNLGPWPIGAGWFSGGGYLPVGYPSQPSGPGTPIAPTPETGTFGLLMIGMGFLIIRSVRKGR